MDLTDIKPCPACGKKAELLAGWSFWIECECGEQTDGWLTIEGAIEDWNDRTSIGDTPAPQSTDVSPLVSGDSEANKEKG